MRGFTEGEECRSASQDISERSAALRTREQAFAAREARLIAAEETAAALRNEVEGKQRSLEDAQAEAGP